MISDKILNVAVYCSAAGDLPESWVDAARELGRWIGRRGATLVYGGVDAGLMTVVARGVRDGGGGRVTGVIPDLRRDMASPLNDTEIAVAGLAERKAVMCRMADVYVVLPGGYGTLDEFFTTLADILFNPLTGKTIILYNPDGLYDSLLAQFDTLVAAGLIRQGSFECIRVAASVEELISSLERYTSEN